MPLHLEGSCRCGAVRFACDSHTPHPYQLCYCSICRKTAGGGGFAINLMGTAKSLAVRGKKALRVYRAEIRRTTAAARSAAASATSAANARARCGCSMRAGRTSFTRSPPPSTRELPKPPSRVHLMLKFKASWVEPAIGPDDRCFDEYPEQSIEDWHKSRGLWID